MTAHRYYSGSGLTRRYVNGPLQPMDDPGPLGALWRSMPLRERVTGAVIVLAVPALVWGAAVMGPM